MKTAILLLAAFAANAQTGRTVTATILPSPTAAITGYNLYMQPSAGAPCVNNIAGSTKLNTTAIPPATPITFTTAVIPFGAYCFFATVLKGADESLPSPPFALDITPRPEPPGGVTAAPGPLVAVNVTINFNNLAAKTPTVEVTQGQ
jgi:hypothetical protein